MNRIFKTLILLIFVSCGRTPDDQIIDYAKKKYGDNFKEGAVDLSDVYKFKWQTLYIFSPLTYPEDITKEIGFKYTGDIVPDDRYLFLFVNSKKVVRQYIYSDLKIGFSDDNHTGVYKVKYKTAKYIAKFTGHGCYWLYKK